jgi:hypothetical protein
MGEDTGTGGQAAFLPAPITSGPGAAATQRKALIDVAGRQSAMTKRLPLRKWDYFVVAGNVKIGWLAFTPGKRSRLCSIKGGKPVGSVD